MIQPAPSGVVSFLFTDIEGSTRLWEEDTATAARSVELHDGIVRAAVDSHHGHVFSTGGDGFGVAFSNAVDAISAAVDIQLELSEMSWPGSEVKVRMGIHTGAADERDGDYFGPVLNRAARIMAAGNGGQVLLSAVTADVAADSPHDSVTFEDRGIHHLKDLDEPEHIYVVAHPRMPPVTTPLRTVDARRHNLPRYLTEFVGRDRQLADLEEALSDHRLVVLTGVGGTGKTRLAVEGAHRALASHPDGAWLVELAPITNPAFIMTAIGDVWGLRAGEGASIDEVVARFLSAKELLIVLDNCEHLLDGAASAIRHLLDASPGVQVVATSRESLGIPGERIIQVPSLTLPTEADPAGAESTRLFVARAAEARPDFDPDEAELGAIARICRRIDGIPLGLELAAARLRSMSAPELADRLEHSFRILSGSAKASLPRQRTLQATIDWSHELLTPPEAEVFRRLAVFAGGFDLEAAEAVCSGGEVEEWEIVDHLDSLVDKSLVLSSGGSSGWTRFWMLEPVRQYAQEKLAASDDANWVQAAHALHYAQRVTAAGPRLRGPSQVAERRRLDADYANVRAALVTLAEQRETERFLQMAFDLFPYWMQAGMHVEAIETAVGGLEAVDDDTDLLLQAKTWWTTACLGAEITRPTAVDHAQRGLAAAERLGDANVVGRLHLILGAAIRHSTTSPDYLDALLEGRHLLDENETEPWWEPEWDRGILEFLFGAYLPADDEQARQHQETAIGIFESLGDEVLLAATLVETVTMRGADEAWVMGNLRRAIEILDRIDVPYWKGHAHMYVGIFLILDDEFARGTEYLTLAASNLEDCGDLFCWATTTRTQAIADAEMGNFARAKERLTTVIDALPRIAMRDIVRARLVDIATRVLVAAGDFERAGRALGFAHSLELDPEAVPGRTEQLAAIRESLVDKLGEESTEEMMADGAALDIDTGLESVMSWLPD